MVELAPPSSCSEPLNQVMFAAGFELWATHSSSTRSPSLSGSLAFRLAKLCATVGAAEPSNWLVALALEASFVRNKSREEAPTVVARMRAMRG